MCSLNAHLTFYSVNDFATIFFPRFFLVHTSIILVEQAINAKLFIEHYILFTILSQQRWLQMFILRHFKSDEHLYEVFKSLSILDSFYVQLLANIIEIYMMIKYTELIHRAFSFIFEISALSFRCLGDVAWKSLPVMFFQHSLKPLKGIWHARHGSFQLVELVVD